MSRVWLILFLKKKLRFRYTGILLVENGQNIIYLFSINMYSIDNDSLWQDLSLYIQKKRSLNKLYWTKLFGETSLKEEYLKLHKPVGTFPDLI